MAHDVFISHSSKDKTVADATCAILESNGIRCWIAPRDILPGTEWGASIVAAISQSKVFVLVFSANANSSTQINREVERAVNHAVPVIPLRIENVMPTNSLEYFLSSPHWLDAYTPPLQKHLEYLVGVILKILNRDQNGIIAPTDKGTVSTAPDAETVLTQDEIKSNSAIAEKPGKAESQWGIMLGAAFLATVIGATIYASQRPTQQAATQTAKIESDAAVSAPQAAAHTQQSGSDQLPAGAPDHLASAKPDQTTVARYRGRWLGLSDGLYFSMVLAADGTATVNWADGKPIFSSALWRNSDFGGIAILGTSSQHPQIDSETQPGEIGSISGNIGVDGLFAGNWDSHNFIGVRDATASPEEALTRHRPPNWIFASALSGIAGGQTATLLFRKTNFFQITFNDGTTFEGRWAYFGSQIMLSGWAKDDPNEMGPWSATGVVGSDSISLSFQWLGSRAWDSIFRR